MIEENDHFKIDFLDHVAIRVKDLSLAVSWYGNVLGLKKYQLPEWGDYPIFMLTNKTGVALFPTKISDTEVDLKVK
ncbi:MAG: VOC family protein, partial [Maribacter sp.]